LAHKIHVVLKVPYEDIPKVPPKLNPHKVLKILSYCCSPYNNFRPDNQIIPCCIFPTVYVPLFYLLHFLALCINFGNSFQHDGRTMSWNIYRVNFLFFPL
jgi:hypothetical protein